MYGLHAPVLSTKLIEVLALVKYNQKALLELIWLVNHIATEKLAAQKLKDIRRKSKALTRADRVVLQSHY